MYTRRVDYEIDCTSEEIPCPHYDASEDTGNEKLCYKLCML